MQASYAAQEPRCYVKRAAAKAVARKFESIMPDLTTWFGAASR
jgi:hypothetical protein